MSTLEVILTVILTLLGIVVLLVLIVRWTRRRQFAQVSGYTSSELSAGLLDYEDGFFCKKRGGRTGSRSTISIQNEVPKGSCTQSMTSLRGPSGSFLAVQATNCPAVCKPNPDRTRSTKCLQELRPCNTGVITGTVGPTMKFSVPICPGTKGPISLSQRTVVQTPGATDEPTGICTTVESTREVQPRTKSHPRSSQTASCPPTPPPIIILQKSGAPGTPIIVRQAAGCIDRGHAKRSDSKALVIKQGGCTHVLRKKLRLEPKECSPSRRRGRGGAAKRCPSHTTVEIGMPKKGESQLIRLEMGVPRHGGGREIVWCEPESDKKPESKASKESGSRTSQKGGTDTPTKARAAPPPEESPNAPPPDAPPPPAP